MKVFFVKKRKLAFNLLFIYIGGDNIKKYPFIKQKGIKECGPICSLMILKYYGGYTSAFKLSEMMNTNQNGTTAYNLINALKEIGFEASGVKLKSVDDLKLPCIAHVVIENSYNHYVVIYEVNLSKRLLLVADPASNLKWMKEEEFMKIWSGVAIFIHPKNQIIKDSEPKTVKFIWYYIKSNIKLFLLVSILALILSILNIITSLSLPILMYRYSLNVCLFMFILWLLEVFITYLSNKYLNKLNYKINNMLSFDVFKMVLSLPYRYYRRKTTGEITSYFSQLYTVRDFINNLSQILLTKLPLIIIIIFLSFSDSILLALNITFIFIYLLIMKHYFKKHEVWTDEIMRKNSLVNSFMVESISGYETIKNLNITSKIFSKFKEKYLNFSNYSYTYTSKINKEFIIKEILYYIFIFLIMVYAILKKVNSATFISYFILSSLLLSSLKSILEFDILLKEALSSLKALAELKLVETENKKETSVKGDIVLKNVSYYYNKTDKVLNNINLKIKKGEKVLVTGDSGLGKSTLFKIIKGYLNDYLGSVQIGNLERHDFNFKDIIYISQKEILFTESILENIKLGNENLKNLDICEIDDLNLYDLIEEDGFNLSGGQKQRIILVRALTDFQILIIDEALSGVDINMERRILKKLFNRYQNKTIIYITHRLDNLDLFDNFIKLDKKTLSVKRNN